MTITSPSLLSDRELLDETTRVVACERRTTAELLALLAELDTRRLYLAEGYSSLFTYCTHHLHLSEPAAYGRITAARAARRFPMILGLLAAGDVTLTTVSLLAARLTDENYEALLSAARHKSKRDVERLVASLDAQPDIPSSVRRVTSPRAEGQRPTASSSPVLAAASAPAAKSGQEPWHTSAPSAPPAPPRRPILAALGPDRYLLKITLGEETRRKLQRARDLLRHAIPGGDPAAIVDRALTLLVEQLERRKIAATPNPHDQAADSARTRRGRHVPAAAKRAVWTRDEGRCVFVGSRGRCGETGLLEFHHVIPFAEGGTTDVANLQLRCRAHNQYEAVRYFGFERQIDPGSAADTR